MKGNNLPRNSPDILQRSIYLKTISLNMDIEEIMQKLCLNL